MAIDGIGASLGASGEYRVVVIFEIRALSWWKLPVSCRGLGGICFLTRGLNDFAFRWYGCVQRKSWTQTFPLKALSNFLWLDRSHVVFHTFAIHYSTPSALEMICFLCLWSWILGCRLLNWATSTLNSVGAIYGRILSRRLPRPVLHACLRHQYLNILLKSRLIIDILLRPHLLLLVLQAILLPRFSRLALQLLIQLLHRTQRLIVSNIIRRRRYLYILAGTSRSILLLH